MSRQVGKFLEVSTIFCGAGASVRRMRIAPLPFCFLGKVFGSVALVWLCLVPGVQAYSTFRFSGTITEVVSDSFGVADGWGSVGSPFWGSFSYDPDWHNGVGGSVFNDAETYSYNQFRDPPDAFINLLINTDSQSQTINGDLGLVVARVTHSAGNDIFELGGEYGHGYFGSIRLADGRGSALGNTSLPLDFALSQWGQSHSLLLNGFPEGAYVRGEISSLYLVPEPGVTALLAIAALFLIGLRRFKKQ